MIPTRDQINRLAAEACGWTNFKFCPYWQERQPHARLTGTSPNGNPLSYVPDYCSDRNALVELWDMVEAEQVWEEYSHSLRGLCQKYSEKRFYRSRTFAVSSASPLLVTVAALKALGKWDDSWEIPQEASE